MKFKSFILYIFLLFSTYVINAQITVTNSNVAATLVQKLVGLGVTVTNPTITCSSNGAGYFTSTNAMLGIDSGVVLTTGYAATSFFDNGVNNPASILATETRNFNAGDINLYNLASANNSNLSPNDVNDVCKLEFDFVPQGDTIRFKYRFASEEYPDFVCSNFNDVFAFFITGTPGYPIATNLAVIPGTSIPVAINSVNAGSASFGFPFSNCTNMGLGSPFTTYFNSIPTNTTITYNGITDLMEAKAVVVPCSTYHMKFAIADILDFEYDSGVFLKSGSFVSDNVTFDSIHSPTALPLNWPYSTEGCNSDTIYIKRPIAKPTPQIIYVTIGGTAINGIDVVTIPATIIIPANDTIGKIIITPILDALIEGNEILTIGLKTFACNTYFSDTMTVIINEFPAYTLTDNDTICFGQSKTLTATLAYADTNIKFTWMPGNISGSSFTFTPFSTATYTVTSKYPGCPSRDSTVQINVAQYPTINAGIDTVICSGTSVQLNAIGNTTPPYPINYSWTPSGTLNNSTILNPIASPFSPTTYIITATNIAGCTKTDAINVTVKPIINITAANTPANCSNTNGTITMSNSANATNLNYTLLPNNITNTTGLFTNLQGNTVYTITASNASYCTTNITVNLQGFIPFQITNLTKTNINCFNANNGTASITTGGTGIITFTLLPTNSTNNSGIFSNLMAGTYTIQAADVQGCSTNTTFTITQPNQLIINSIIKQNINCFGQNTGSIAINASGGNGSFSYNITPSTTTNLTGVFANLFAGTYSLQVSDANGCSVTTTTILTQQPAMSNLFSIDTALCSPLYSGEININTISVNNITTYSLINQFGNTITSSNNIFSNLQTGNYTLTTTDNLGCSITNSIFVPTYLSPTFTASTINNVSCNAGTNGFINTTINNPSSSIITYSINPSITNLNTGQFTNAPSGNYTISLVDNHGCTTSTNVTINQPTILNFTNTTSSPTLCNGTNTGIVSASAIGGTGLIQYILLNNGSQNSSGIFNNLGAAIYTVQAIDANNCTTTTTITVSQPSNLSFTPITKQNVACFGGNNGSISISTIGGSGLINYTLNTVAANPPFTNLISNNYSIVATDNNGCNISTVVNINQPNLLSITNTSSSVLSCVPGNDAIISCTANGGTNPLAYVLNNSITNATGTFNNLGAGNYTLQITDANNCTTNSFITITNPILPVILNVNTAPTGCNPNNTGSATVILQSTSTLNQFTINGIFQNSNTFNNLIATSYTLIVKNNLGCADTSNFNIQTTTNPIVNNVILTPESCVPGCDGVANITASNGTGNLNYQINNGPMQISNVFTNLCNASYTVNVVDANGCTANTILQMTTRPNPSVNSIVTNNITCNGLNNGSIILNISGGSPTYTYSINNAGSVSNNVFNNLLPNNYTIVATDIYGCSTMSSTTITQPTTLFVNSFSGIMPSCFAGNNGSVIANASGGTGSISYQLNGGNAQVSSTFNNQIGNTTYTVIATDNNGCTSQSTLFLNQPPSLQFNTIIKDSVSCWNSIDGGLTVNASGGTGLITYSIYPSTSSNTTGMFTNLFASIYTITITDINNCSIDSITNVPQPQPLVLNAPTGTPVTCNGTSNGTIAATGSGGFANYTFTLLNNNSTNSTGNFTGLSGAIYTIQLSDAVGCTRISTITILEPSPLLFDIVNVQNVQCNGQSNGQISVSTIGGNNNNVYSINTIGTPSNTIGNFSSLSANTYTVSVADINLCSSQTVVVVTQPNAISILSTVVAPTCYTSANGIIQFSANGGVPQYNYTLLPVNSTNQTGLFNNLVGNTYFLTITDANGCTSTTSTLITTPSPIVIDSIGVQNIICNNDTVGSIIVNASGGTGAISYTLQPGAIINTSGFFNNLAANVYTITMQDANACSNSTLVAVTQNAKITLTSTNLINPICEGGNEGIISFTANGGLPPLTFSFNNSAFTSTASYSNLILGTYSLSIKDQAGCKLDTTFILNSPLTLVVNIDSFNNVVCPGLKDAEIHISAQFGNAGGYNFLILPINLVNNTGHFTGVPQGSYTVLVTDTKGCTGTNAITIIPSDDTIKVNLRTVPITCQGYGKDGSVIATPIGGTPPFTYSWLNRNEVTNTIDSLPYGLYIVNIKDKNGCQVTDTILLNASPCCEVYIPNAFTPNNDGSNDVFIPKSSSSKLLLQFDVYDRFGNNVFSTTQDNLGWDGTFKGQALDIDTYFYIYRYKCYYNNEVRKELGDVQLIR